MTRPTLASLALAALLTGCAAPEPEQWGRADGAAASPADKARFGTDEARCEYEVAQVDAYRRASASTVQPSNAYAELGAALGRSGATSGLFERCMRAAGWARRG
jgi:hypothetical protein